ncbi:hypothetical protein [Paucibacter sp. Y2R2-4]|uniref:hypothetical protein n=1 Tax=Paucibacter sp. Y2R2-4 TaxID=2893553 RepID=UPI0021E43F3B|nr:hypothetical protein [Paucibacter sp. Y2R2-4]MCV2350665.1 hypothetical protein [Paucibacter sp. Y2R2-4]
MSSLVAATFKAFRPARLAALLLPAALLSACETVAPLQVLVPEEVQQRAQLCAMQSKKADGQPGRSACGHQAAQTGGTSSWTDTDNWDLGLLGQRKTSRVAKFNFEFTPAGGPTERWRCETKEREFSKHVVQLPVAQSQDRELSCTYEGPHGTEQLRHSSLQGDTVIWTLGGQEETWTMVGISAWRSGEREGNFVMPMAWCLRNAQGQWMSCHDRWRRPGSFWMMPLDSALAARRAALLALAPLDLEPLR